MPKFKGSAHIYGTCADHSAKGTIIEVYKPKYNLSTDQIVKATHIHCYECGCFKSRGNCPIENFTFEPQALTPDYDLINPSSATKMGPEKIDFSFNWEYDGKKFNVYGSLPPDLATKITDVINKP